jgi:hypothetical protein
MNGAPRHRSDSECQVPGNMDVLDETVRLNPIWKDERNKKVFQIRDNPKEHNTDSDAK